MPTELGIVAIDTERRWIGGRYYLQHVIRCVAALPLSERPRMRDVWWSARGENDPFLEVRTLMSGSVVVDFPKGAVARVRRRLSRLLRRVDGASDLFRAAGFDVFFPIPPCDNAGMPYVYWLPDFQYLRRPDLMSEDLRAELERMFRHHVEHAARIVLSSEDARSDFANVFPEALGRTHVVRFCSVPDEDWWRVDPAEAASRYRLPERFFIVSNQMTRHKNHLTVVRALQQLAANGADVHVVCTGSTFDHRGEDYVGQVQALAAQLGVAHRLYVLGLVPRADQIALMRRAIAILQPSAFEGWSTIIEDAKTLGKLLLASDLPVHKEQLGSDHRYLLPVEDAPAWTAAMTEVLVRASPGPDAVAELAGRDSLEARMMECGRAFIAAIAAATKGRGAAKSRA